MDLCNDGHEEICYEGSTYDPCPFCTIIKEKVDEISELEEKNSELQTQIDEHEAERTGEE